MHLGNISFCDRLGYNIKSDDVKKKLLEELEARLEFKVIQKHYLKYDAATSPAILQNRPHMMCARTNGNPYLLLLTHYNFTNQCIFIDKKIQQGYYYPRMIVTKLWFDDSLFQNNTVLDGEMVRLPNSNNKWIFVIHDLICDRGASLASMNLMRRISRVYEILKTQYYPDAYDVCQLQVKRFFKIDEVGDMLQDFIPSLPYTCRGIYFKPLFQKFKDILLNFDDSLIKSVHRESYKQVGNFLLKTSAPHGAGPAPLASISTSSGSITEALDSDSGCDDPASNSVSIPIPHDNGPSPSSHQIFYARKTNVPDVYHLYETQSSMVRYHVACIPSMQVSKMMREKFKFLNPLDHIAMECSFSERFKKWIPMQELAAPS